MIIWILIIIFVIFISELMTYKVIKKIDKTERKKLYNWELKYVKELQRQNAILKKGQKNDNNSVTNSSNNDGINVLEFKTSGKDNLQATK